jgi:hypothetical protein
MGLPASLGGDSGAMTSVRGFAVAFFLELFSILAGVNAQAAALAVDVRAGDKADTYVVAVKNTGTAPLHVVGKNTRTDAFVPMSLTLRGNYVASSQGSSEKPAPYLVIESRLASGDRILVIHPPEQAKASLIDASYEDLKFIFFSGQEYLCTIRLPAAPTQVEVRWIEADERSRVLLARWHAGRKQKAFSKN